MISILIPVFNKDANELVATLSNQLSSAEVPGEIIVADDGSIEQIQLANQKVSALPWVTYKINDANAGRVEIRKQLVNLATYDYVLFLDCDSKIISPDFFLCYYQHTDESTDVIVGGRVYTRDKPADCNYRLHWKYGSKREKISISKKKRTHTKDSCRIIS